MASKVTNPPHSDARGRVWHFAECTFDELRCELRVRDVVAELEVKPLEVLHQLLLRAGDVVSKEELLDSVWPGVLVVDASLATAVSKLRKALGSEDIIKTVPKVGYRLSVPVHCEYHRGPSLVSETPMAPVENMPGRHGMLASFSRGRVIGWSFALVAVLGLTLGFSAFRNTPKQNITPAPVAILPFQNAGSDPGLDYLRSALPDEIANTLSAARSLTIRPLAATTKYGDPNLDLGRAAKELNVNRLVTGRYVLANDQLQITMEAVDTNQSRVVWHDTFNVPANNLLTLQAQVAAISRGKLAGALGITDFVKDTAPTPTNQEAYELYLRSTALDWDPAPNREGLELLRKAVALDPTYAPAWGLLSLRYYTASRYGGGGREMLQLSDAAAERLFELDPGSPDGIAELTIHRTERGDLVKAHQQALELVRRRPDNPNNHHVLNYVLRYGGSIDEAAHECDMVVLLASRIVWGSCAITFLELGDYTRARDFLRKDLSSEWSKAYAIETMLRAGKTQEAIRIGAPKIEHWGSYKMLLACASQQPQSQIDELAKQVEVADDPEVSYFFASHLAYCGKATEAVRMLKLAIDHNYCSYPTMDRDPFFDKVRNTPAFVKVRADGMACHENFAANREVPPKSADTQTIAAN